MRYHDALIKLRQGLEAEITHHKDTTDCQDGQECSHLRALHRALEGTYKIAVELSRYHTHKVVS